MIGASTLILKVNGKHDAYRISNFWNVDLLTICRRHKQSVFGHWKARWKTLTKGHRSLMNISPAEVNKIRLANNCLPELKGRPGHHQFASDGVYLLDLDVKKFYMADGETLEFEELTVKGLERRYRHA